MKKLLTLVRVVLVMTALTLLSGLQSCTIPDSLNVSPNSVDQSKLGTVDGVNGLLVGTQTMTGDFYCGDRSRVVSLWDFQVSAPPGFGGRSQPNSWMNYTMDQTGPPNDMWLYAYKPFRTANDLERFASIPTFSGADSTNANTRSTIIGIAQFHKALILGEVACLWGSAPVAIHDVDPAPFISQTEIFNLVQLMLDSALGNVKNPNVIGSHDLNFGGDADLWKAAIHSLKARYYLQVSDHPHALAESKLGISSGAGSLFARYSASPLENSQWGHWVTVEGSYAAEKLFVDSLKSEPGDKRLAEYFLPQSGTEIIGYAGHTGVVNAHGDTLEKLGPNDSASLDESKIATVLKYGGIADPFPIISYEENLLIRAEAEARGGDVAGAVTDVNVIRLQAGLTAFVSTDAAATIAQVLKQKWLQLFLEGQAYHDMRRTQTLPDPRPNADLRIIYPQSERNTSPYVPADNDALVKPLLGY